jgi:hypothetical protein
MQEASVVSVKKQKINPRELASVFSGLEVKNPA